MSFLWLFVSVLVAWQPLCDSSMRMPEVRKQKLSTETISNRQHNQRINIGNQSETLYLCLSGTILQTVCQQNSRMDPDRKPTLFESLGIPPINIIHYLNRLQNACKSMLSMLS